MGQRLVDRVNLDFEWVLNGDQTNSKNIISSFEYIYFIINKSPERVLLAHRKYSKNYINYLSSFGFNTEHVFEAASPLNWWAPLDNEELVKKLNSKIYALSVSEKIGHCPKTIVFDKLKDIPVSEDQSLIKNDIGVSGNGNYVIACNTKVDENIVSKKIGHGPYLYQPYLNRVMDFGITLDLDNESYFSNENFMGQFGRFSGGRLMTNVELLDLLQSFGIAGDKVLKELIIQFKSMGATGIIQFDNFTYKDAQQNLNLYFMCEINYRKTMGLVLKSLKEHFHRPFGQWHIFPKNLNEKAYNELLNKYKDNKDVVITSPENVRFLSAYFMADSDSVILELINIFKSDLGVK
ncbi:hypothetical protein [Bacteriovorax sp. BSW11_IV]|uniref:hypothetical protein n=1 Tax=Bacteriovorax sp. BSW11_IV TaxID=1353529 RepID=UPI00054EC1A8|nr:hypothetical protein [Bacteriovorax sp. BSW11_IV]